MVRLRMTQQINHYLGKLRDSGQQAAGAGTGARLYRNVTPDASVSHLVVLQQNNTSTGWQAANKSSTSLARIEAHKFQQLLEQAHRWIMAKTELIALDVPQRLQQRATSSQQQVGSTVDGKRLHPGDALESGQSSNSTTATTAATNA